MKKLLIKSIPPYLWMWAILVTVFMVTWLVAATGHISAWWLILPTLLLLVSVYDMAQNRHALLKNFPLIGRLRYALESIRPELRQYFFEGEMDGKPFSRRQRSIVYQRAKNEKQTISFGMQDDPGRPGFEWLAHSVYPKKADPSTFRIRIGHEQCRHPYEASLLNIGAMSYGALSKTAISSLNQGAAIGGFAHNTGEGGISPYHLHGGDLIWQIGTGYFGCRNNDGSFSPELFAQKAALPAVKMIELKLSQGAKPGHGGLLPAAKNTPEIAAIRHVPAHTPIQSPAAHSAFTDPTSLMLFVQQLRDLSGGKPIGFKLCLGQHEEFVDIVMAMLDTGIMPDFISIDGGEGGTGAAPLEFIDNLGMPLTDALVFIHQTLSAHGLRKHIRLLASGKIITAFDIARVIALGADACYSSRGMMFALGCIQALQCDSDTCPVGIATQNKSLYTGIQVADKRQRVANFHANTMRALADLTGACGLLHPRDLKADMFFRRTVDGHVRNLRDLYTPHPQHPVYSLIHSS